MDELLRKMPMYQVGSIGNGTKIGTRFKQNVSTGLKKCE